jgi:hypothetical protein
VRAAPHAPARGAFASRPAAAVPAVLLGHDIRVTGPIPRAARRAAACATGACVTQLARCIKSGRVRARSHHASACGEAAPCHSSLVAVLMARHVDPRGPAAACARMVQLRVKRRGAFKK